MRRLFSRCCWSWKICTMLTRDAGYADPCFAAPGRDEAPDRRDVPDVEVDRSHPLSAALAELRRMSRYERVLLRGLNATRSAACWKASPGRKSRGARGGGAPADGREPAVRAEVVRYLAEED